MNYNKRNNIFITNMPQIEVKNLTKKFKIRNSEITAVDNVSFNIEQAETIAFIGPNGAGKSTTIKMLTGILFPTTGEALVLGINPWKDRQKLAFQIGTVFGQKSQLSFHLPAKDSFNLFSKIYELDEKDYRSRLNPLIEIFDIKNYLDQPLRKLSLGQRMRCEIVASLLHNPKIIFLDEPTIGLDVIAKRELRDTLKTLNKMSGTTIFLTSHDTGDIEALCKRTIIVNHGSIIFDDKTANLKRQYIKVKRLYVRFENVINTFQMDDVKVMKQSPYGVSLELDTTKRSIRSVLGELIEKYTIIDINVEDPSTEEIISGIYKK